MAIWLLFKDPKLMPQDKLISFIQYYDSTLHLLLVMFNCDDSRQLTVLQRNTKHEVRFQNQAIYLAQNTEQSTSFTSDVRLRN